MKLVYIDGNHMYLGDQIVPLPPLPTRQACLKPVTPDLLASAVYRMVFLRDIESVCLHMSREQNITVRRKPASRDLALATSRSRRHQTLTCCNLLCRTSNTQVDRTLYDTVRGAAIAESIQPQIRTLAPASDAQPQAPASDDAHPDEADNVAPVQVVQEWINANRATYRKICKTLLEHRDVQGMSLTRLLRKTWGVSVPEISAQDHRQKIDQFILDSGLCGELCDVQVRDGVHFGKFDENGDLVFYLCIITAEINNCKFKNVVSIEWIINISGGNLASRVVDGMKCEVARRYQKCFLVTQAAPIARKFWLSKMSPAAPKAGALIALLHIFFGLKLYGDVTYMVA